MSVDFSRWTERSTPAAAPDLALSAARGLERWGAARDWEGTDPYDGLNAGRVPRSLRRGPLARRLLTQAVKRSPVSLRPLLGVPPGRSAAALACVIAAYARNGILPQDEANAKLQRAIDRLESLRCTGFSEPCWGYHFDVQTRVFFYPRTQPNTIATAFAGLSLLDAYERRADSHALELAAGAGDFFVRHIPQTETDSGAYFGYLVGDGTPIHNANMLVCALLARLSRHLDRPDFLEAASAGVRYTVTRQRPDGSWPYGEQPHLAWIDNFHTGYVLDCLLHCDEAGVGDDADTAWENGLSYYRRELFLPDGTPKYAPASVYPVDAQCAAQAMQTFALGTRRNSACTAWAWSAFSYAYERLRRGDGSFIFQRRRFWLNRTPHIRWVQAPMLLALTHLINEPGT